MGSHSVLGVKCPLASMLPTWLLESSMNQTRAGPSSLAAILTHTPFSNFTLLYCAVQTCTEFTLSSGCWVEGFPLMATIPVSSLDPWSILAQLPCSGGLLWTCLLLSYSLFLQIPSLLPQFIWVLSSQACLTLSFPLNTLKYQTTA
jgi:hypothetical protein